MTTPDPQFDRLRDAIQDYARETGGRDLVLTDFAIAYAAITMRTADSQAWIATAAHGAPHATLGLAHVLVNDLAEGDDA